MLGTFATPLKADVPTHHVEPHLSLQYQLNCAAFDGALSIPWLWRVLLSDWLDNSNQQPHQVITSPHKMC
jgi:hypothetical protein